MKNNIWRFAVKDKDGKLVETAPGMKSITVRGPGNLPELIRSANILLYGKRLDVVRIGLPDPGYVLDTESIEPLGHTDQTDTDLGQWMPSGGISPVQLPTDPAVRDAHMKLIAERLGVPQYELDADGNVITSAPAPVPARPAAKRSAPEPVPAAPPASK